MVKILTKSSKPAECEAKRFIQSVQYQQHKPEHVSRQYWRYKDCNGFYTVDVNLNLLPPSPCLGVPVVFLEAVKAQCCTIFCWCSCFSCLNLDLCLTPFDTCALTQPRLGVCFGSDPGDWETLGPAERSLQPLGNSLPGVCVELLCSMFNTHTSLVSGVAHAVVVQ